MANDHPFQNLFETLGRIPAAHAESVNRQAYEILSDILTVPLEKAGRCIMLRAPRAGHGKTHLLSRIQHRLGGAHEFIPLHAAFGCRIDASTVTEDTLRRLVRQLPASGGLTVLDLVARRLFAFALQPLVTSGEVPSEDRDGALAALRNRPVETFDFHHPNATTAHWAKANFALLSQRLSYELAQRSGLPVREIDFWVGVLFRYSAAPLENPNRARVLTESLQSGTGLEMDRLEALLGLLTLQTRVVLIADDLEGFSTDETAALRLAAFLGTLRQSVERVDVILSLNQDIWQSAFTPRLSGGLADRLSEMVVELEPLTEAEMIALLDSRAPGLGKEMLGNIDVAKSGNHARGLIRAAGLAWLKGTAADSISAAPIEPLQKPLPVVAQPHSPAAPEPTPVFPVLAPVFEPAPEPKTPVYHCPPPLPPQEPAPAAPEKTVFFATKAPEEPKPSDVKPVTSEDYSFVLPPALEKTPPPESAPSPSAEVPELQDSPFKIVLENPSAAPFEPPQEAWISARPPVSQDAPMAATPPEFTPEPVAAAFFQAAQPVFQAPEPVSQTTPASAAEPPTFQLPPDSPFEISQPEQPAPVKPQAGSDPFAPFAATPVTRPSTANPEPAVADTDRVDDLLRQFRERYGRGSL